MLKVGILSDIHIPAIEPVEKNLYNALMTFKEKNVDLILLAGDLIDQDRKWAADIFNDIYNDVYPNSKPELLGIYGNHETMENIHVISSNYENDFKNWFNQESINIHKVINGFHFILVSSNPNVKAGRFSEDSKERKIDSSGDYLYIKDWLKKEIDDANDGSLKPIFVVTHFAPKNTILGTHTMGSGNEELYDALKDYPNVVSLSGHSHFSLCLERSINQKDFTSINTGSLQCSVGTFIDLINDDKTYEPMFLEAIPGDGYRRYPTYLYLEIDDNKLTFERYIASSINQKYGENWVINYPIKKEDFKYNDDRKFNQERIEFGVNDRIKCYSANEKDYFNVDTLEYFVISIPKSSNRIYGFKIILSGKENKEYYVYSEIDDYIFDPKKYMLFKAQNLKPGIYHVECFAFDEYGNYSINSLKNDFEVLKNER